MKNEATINSTSENRNEVHDTAKTIVKLLILNFKYIFKNLLPILLMLSLLVSGSMFVVIFVPLRYCVIGPYFIGAIIPAMCMYVSVTYVWRDGTLYSNYKITSKRKTTFYVSAAIQFFILVVAFSLIITALLGFYNWLDILMVYWRGAADELYGYKLSGLISLPFFYSLFELSLVAFSLLVLLQYFIKSQKMMFVVILMLLILEILFGGILNNHFMLQNIVDSENNYLEARGLYPPELFWPTEILFPFFAPSQHMQSLRYFSSSNIYIVESLTKLNWFSWESPDTEVIYELSDEAFSQILGASAHRWNSLWIMPYIHTTIFTSIAITLSLTRRND